MTEQDKPFIANERLFQLEQRIQVQERQLKQQAQMLEKLKHDQLESTEMGLELFTRFKRACTAFLQDEPAGYSSEMAVRAPRAELMKPRIEYRDKIVTPDWALKLNDWVEMAQGNTAIASILFGDVQGDQRVVRLLVCGSQWSNILRVWDALAEQCKESQQAASTSELNILKACVTFYNQTLQDCQVQFQSVQVGESYDYNIHQRANIKGDRIQSVLLPGLLNAACDITRPALVFTT